MRRSINASRENVMSKETMQNAGDSAAEKPETNNGKIVGGVVVGLLGVALGAVFD
jgi:hypothetical protein